MKIKKEVKKTPAKTDSVRFGGNILDSSGPRKRRGKEREKPKKRKLTNLKKIILEEKRRKRLQREGKLQDIYAWDDDELAAMKVKDDQLGALRADMHKKFTSLSESPSKVTPVESQKESESKENIAQNSQTQEINKESMKKLSESIKKISESVEKLSDHNINPVDCPVFYSLLQAVRGSPQSAIIHSNKFRE